MPLNLTKPNQTKNKQKENGAASRYIQTEVSQVFRPIEDSLE